MHIGKYYKLLTLLYNRFFCYSFRKDIPFSEWSLDDVCDWLTDLGLESSVTEARRWAKGGAALLAASPQEIDKELNIKVKYIMVY